MFWVFQLTNSQSNYAVTRLEPSVNGVYNDYIESKRVISNRLHSDIRSRLFQTIDLFAHTLITGGSLMN